jgi:cytidylate kinase
VGNLNRTVTIGGLHGTGKSSVADKVAKHFKLRRVSAGAIFRAIARERGYSLEEFSRIAEGNEEIDRELDARQKEEAKTGNVVLDGQLSAWMAGEHADFRILLTASQDVRIARIAGRDGVSVEEATQETVGRERSEMERYKEYYGIDISELSKYDLIVNTEKFSLQGVVKVIVAALNTFFSGG